MKPLSRSPRLAITVSVVFCARIWVKRLALPGSSGPSCHVTLSACAALTASHSCPATTPTKIALAHHARGRDVLDRAFVHGERLGAGPERALPARQHHAAMEHVWEHADDGRVRIVRSSCPQVDARRPRPDQLVAMWGLLRRRPREFDVERLVAKEIAIHLTARKAPSPSTDTTPSVTTRLLICKPRRRDASSSSARRASAAAARKCGPPRSIDELELVAPWSA